MRHLVLCGVAVLAACASPAPAPEPELEAWLQGTWAITEIDGVRMEAPSEAEPGPGFIFNPGVLGGYSACNSFSGGYTLDGAALTVTDFISTQRYCGETEGILYAILAAAPEITRVDADHLTVRGNGGRVIKASRMAPPPP